jgi:hypothetical protein
MMSSSDWKTNSINLSDSSKQKVARPKQKSHSINSSVKTDMDLIDEAKPI